MNEIIRSSTARNFSTRSKAKGGLALAIMLALAIVGPGAANAAWVPYWMSIGGNVTSGPAVTPVPGSYRTDVFARCAGPTFNLCHMVVNGNQMSNWESNAGAPPVSGGMASAPAALYQPSSPGGDRWNIVARAGDSFLYYTYFQPSVGTWRSPWLQVPNGILTTGAALTLNGSNQVDVWATGQGPQRGIWHTVIDTSGSTPSLPGNWEGSPGAPTAPQGVKGAPSAFSRSSGQIDLVVQSADDLMLWHRNFDGSSWSSWTQLPQFFDVDTVEVGLTSSAAGRLDIYARGNGGLLWHTSFSSRQPSGIAWDALPGNPTNMPLTSNRSVSALSTQPGIVDVYASAGPNNNVFTRRFYQNAPVATSGGEKQIAHVSSTGDGWVPTPYSSTDTAAPQPVSTYLVYTGYYENSAVVIPPNGIAPAGGCPSSKRTMVSVGSFGAQSPGQSAMLRTDSLGTSGQTKNVTNKLFQATGINPWVSGLNADGYDNNRYTFGTDNMTVRASNGEIVHVRLGFDRQPPTTGVGFFWRSRDCGASWVSWPTPPAAPLTAGSVMDRHEIYAHPWSPIVYLTAATGVSPFVAIKRMVLTDSTPKFNDISHTGGVPMQQPIVMTSARSGRVFFFSCVSNGNLGIIQPTIHYTPRSPGAGPFEITTKVVSPDDCEAYEGTLDGSESVTRISSGVDGDVARIAYPIFVNENGVRRQKIRVYTMWVSADGQTTSFTEAPGSPIASASSTGSVWQLTAVESSRIELPGDDGTDTALYYWQESSTSPAPTAPNRWGGAGFGNIAVKGLAVRGADITGSRIQLSTSSSLTADKGGDYMRGAFFYDLAHPMTLNYLAIWSIGGVLAGNVVTIPRTF